MLSYCIALLKAHKQYPDTYNHKQEWCEPFLYKNSSVNTAPACDGNEQIMLILVKKIYSNSSFPLYSKLWNFVVKKKSLFVHLSWWNKLHSSMVIFLAILSNIIYGNFQIDTSLLKVSVQSAFMDEET